MTERKLPVGIPSFEEIRNGNYLYVDKTEYVWKLVQTGKLYFLSRPRRFGKSLLTSTLEAYFLGEKELFKGLYIENVEKDWIAYPVLHFDFTGGEYLDEGGLSRKLGRIIAEYEKQYDIQTVDDDLTGKFDNLIKELKRITGKQVVVLVDEYDKPLLDTMEIDEEQEEKNRQIFKSFFGVLKGTDKYLKFVFFTGVTKFSNVSIFSDLNHLNDISLNDSFSGICGITEREMKQNFEPEIKQLAEKRKQSREKCLKELERMYDGYHFSQSGIGVYNPFSLLNAFYNNHYGSYWYATGTTAYLIRKLQNTELTPEAFADGIDAEEEDLSNTQTEKPEPIALLYQTGYLTIKRYDDELEAYILGFPNEEVKYGFLRALDKSNAEKYLAA